MKDRPQEQTPSAVPERAPQDGETRARWTWVETEVWTERMLATLETGIEGGKWFRLIDKVWSPKNVFETVDGYTRGRLRSILRKRMAKRGRGCGRDNQRWPNAYFTAMGLFSLRQTYLAARRSS